MSGEGSSELRLESELGMGEGEGLITHSKGSGESCPRNMARCPSCVMIIFHFDILKLWDKKSF
jgi:hypothetical protein